MRVEHIGPHTLYLGDCREILPTLPRVDAVVTDPPYGIGKIEFSATSYFRKAHPEATIAWDAGRAPDEVIAWIKANAPEWIVWGGNYFADILGACAAPIVWDKDNGNSKFADGEMAFTSMPGTLRFFKHQWAGAFKASERDVIREHPTQKPVALMLWCIEKLPANCTTILDPFAGSGTTGVACVKLGRKFIGIEIEEKYHSIACRRIEEAMRQPDMFVEAPRREFQEALL